MQDQSGVGPRLCINPADGDLAAMTVHAVFERLVPTSRVDNCNMVNSWLRRFRWQELDGNGTFQGTGKRGMWVQSTLMGAVFVDLQPCADGYTTSASRMVLKARHQDANMQEASNLRIRIRIRPPPVPTA